MPFSAHGNADEDICYLRVKSIKNGHVQHVAELSLHKIRHTLDLIFRNDQPAH